MILFIDEAHMLIGAGGTAGGSDAANLLKPALARGELRTIAATTWSEYKKYFPRPAWRVVSNWSTGRASRFHGVDPARAQGALREKVHPGSACVTTYRRRRQVSDRYITGRLLPDRAVDLLDTASAGYAIGLGIKPAELERMERQLSGLAREQSALERDRGNGFPVEDQRLTDIADEQAEIDERRVALEVRWLAERDAALRVLEARKQLTLQAQDLPIPAEGEVVQVLASLEERQAEPGSRGP